MRAQRFSSASGKREAGFSLLEVLVAIVVLAIGLLGLSALQLKGLQSAHSAYQRSLASVIANDAVERLWAALPVPVVATVQNEWLAAWQPSVAAPSRLTLPGVDASTIAVEADGTYLITVRWAEGRFANDHAQASEFTYRIALPEL